MGNGVVETKDAELTAGDKDMLKPEKKKIYDKSDWYFTKVISILIAAAYIVSVIKDEYPFKVKFAFSYDSIFDPLAVIPQLTVVRFIFLIAMGLIVLLEIISIVFLARARAKASSVCDIVSGWSGSVAFAYFYGSLLRFALVPQDEGFSKVMFFAAGILFLILGIAYIAGAIKNRTKLKVFYYLPAIVFALLFIGLFALQTNVVMIKTGFDAVNSDKFEYNAEAVAQADNYLRGAVSVDDELIFIQKLSEEEYGLVKMDSKGNREVLDRAPYIAENNLVINGDYIYYMKYPGFWEDVSIGGVKNAETTFFKLCVMNIRTSDISEYKSDTFAGGVGKILYQSSLIGMRDNKLFLVTRSLENHYGYEVYSIALSCNKPDPASVERYAWNLTFGGILGDRDEMREILYNGLIVRHSDFDYIEFDGFKYELSWYDELQVMVPEVHNGKEVWTGSNIWFGHVNDYNVYGGMLYFVRYNKDDGEYYIYKGETLRSAEIIETIPEPDVRKPDNARLIVSDTYIAIVSCEDIKITNT